MKKNISEVTPGRSKEQPGRGREYYFGTDWFVLTPVNNRVLAIQEPFHVTENVLSYLVSGNYQSVLIDCGMGLADIRRVLPVGKPEPAALLTHTHWDHMGSAADFNNVIVPAHPFEVARVKIGWQPGEMIEMGRENFHPSHQPPDNYSEKTFSLPGVHNFEKIADGEVINLGGITLRAISTPGHTPGSMCYYCEELGQLFTGDMLYPGEEYLHLPESNFEDYQRSLEKLVRETGKSLQIIFPGHNVPSCPPSLLYNHLAASQGQLPPISTKTGADEFGPYTKQDFGKFSFKIGRR